MATPKQLREIFAPVLAQHSDLVLHRRWLFRPPIKTAIVGVFIDRTSSPSGSRMLLSVVPLPRFPSTSTLGHARPFEVEREIGAPAPGGPVPGWMDLPPRIFQDMFAPEYQAQLIRNFNAKVPAFLDAVRSFDEVVAWMQPFRERPLRTNFPELIDAWVAAMHGQFAKASELLQAIPAWLRPNNPRMADRIEQEHAELQSVLRTNDPSAIAAHLHAMEERTIAVDGLQRYWRRTPFPFER